LANKYTLDLYSENQNYKNFSVVLLPLVIAMTTPTKSRPDICAAFQAHPKLLAILDSASATGYGAGDE
jgi:hypothetical protein